MLTLAGVSMKEQEAYEMMNKFSRFDDRIYYEEFVINFLGHMTHKDE